MIDGDLQIYVEYGKWFYPADLLLEAMRQFSDGVPVTKGLIAAPNLKRGEWKEIKTEPVRSSIQINFVTVKKGAVL